MSGGHVALRARRRGAWREIELDRAASTLRIAAGTKLDLGATAKALAADRACAAVGRALGVGVLVALGGDIAALGEPPEGGWEVHVTDDHAAGADAPGERISIQAGGLATSSTPHGAGGGTASEMHHIIDPSSGEPASTRWRTISVAAADCTDANIASTAALLRDADAPAWLESLAFPLASSSGTAPFAASRAGRSRTR